MAWLQHSLTASGARDLQDLCALGMEGTHQERLLCTCALEPQFSICKSVPHSNNIAWPKSLQSCS